MCNNVLNKQTRQLSHHLYVYGSGGCELNRHWAGSTREVQISPPSAVLPKVCAQGGFVPTTAAWAAGEQGCSGNSLWQCPRSPETDHRNFRDTFWLTGVPPCFLDLVPEGNFLRLASAGSGVSNLGLFYSAAGTRSGLMGELRMVLWIRWIRCEFGVGLSILKHLCGIFIQNSFAWVALSHCKSLGRKGESNLRLPARKHSRKDMT